jgi:hypothetical protein
MKDHFVDALASAAVRVQNRCLCVSIKAPFAGLHTACDCPKGHQTGYGPVGAFALHSFFKGGILLKEV